MADITIKKSNLLIEQATGLTLLALKSFDYVLHQAEEQGWDKRFIRVELLALAQFLQLNLGDNYSKYIVSIFRELKSQGLILFDNNAEQVLTEGSYISVFYKERHYIDVKIDDDVKSFININRVSEKGLKDNLKYGFTKLNISKFAQYKSKHAYILAQHIARLRGASKDKEKINISIDTLKRYLGCEKKYQEYYNFYRRAVMPAIEQINCHSSYDITINPVRRNNTVSSIDFIVTLKDFSVEKKIKTVVDDDCQSLVRELYSLGITRKTAETMMQEDAIRARAILESVKINPKYQDKCLVEKSKLIVGMFKNGVGLQEDLQQEIAKVIHSIPLPQATSLPTAQAITPLPTRNNIVVYQNTNQANPAWTQNAHAKAPSTTEIKDLSPIAKATLEKQAEKIEAEKEEIKQKRSDIQVFFDALEQKDRINLCKSVWQSSGNALKLSKMIDENTNQCKEFEKISPMAQVYIKDYIIEQGLLRK